MAQVKQISSRDATRYMRRGWLQVPQAFVGWAARRQDLLVGTVGLGPCVGMALWRGDFGLVAHFDSDAVNVADSDPTQLCPLLAQLFERACGRAPTLCHIVPGTAEDPSSTDIQNRIRKVFEGAVTVAPAMDFLLALSNGDVLRFELFGGEPPNPVPGRESVTRLKRSNVAHILSFSP